MNKVIKVTEGEIFIGKDDGSIVKTDKNNASWNVEVGDVVDVFTNGDTTIINLSKKKKTGNNKFFESIVKCCNKIFPIIFSSVFAFFLIVLIVVCVVPHGKKYVYNETILGVNVKSTITFKGNEIEEVTNTNDNIQKLLYKIEGGKLYTFNNETSEFVYAGDISSTTLAIKVYNYSLIYKENTMIAFRTISIVFMIISGLLDAAAITILILNKKGIIKVKDKVENEIKVEE